MPDEMDHVQAINEQFQTDILNAHHRRYSIAIRKTSEVLKTSEVCTDCGIEIPEKRRQAVPDCTRCVSCQGDYEIHDHWRAL